MSTHARAEETRRDASINVFPAPNPPSRPMMSSPVPVVNVFAVPDVAEPDHLV